MEPGRDKQEYPHHPQEDWIWVARDVPYGPEGEVLDLIKEREKPPKWSRAMDLYFPLRIWPAEERQSIQHSLDRQFQRLRSGQSWDTDVTLPCSVPMWIAVHGGAWGAGSRSQSNLHHVCKTISRRANVIVASVDYRLCRFQSRALYGVVCGLLLFSASVAWFHPSMELRHRIGWMSIAILAFVMLLILCFLRLLRDLNRHPTGVHDVGDAVRWMHQHSHQLGGNPEELILMGHSAGAHLITTLVASPTYWARTGIPIEVVRGVIPVSGLFSAHCMKQDPIFDSLATFVFSSDESTWEEAFACELIRRRPDWKMPSFLFISAQNDHGLIPQTRELFSLLYENNNCPALDWITVESTNHFSVFYFWGAQHYRVLDRVFYFLRIESTPMQDTS